MYHFLWTAQQGWEIDKNFVSALRLVCVFSAVSDSVTLAHKIYIYQTLEQQFFWHWSLTPAWSNALFSLLMVSCSAMTSIKAFAFSLCGHLWQPYREHYIAFAVFFPEQNTHTCREREKMKIALVALNFTGVVSQVGKNLDEHLHTLYIGILGVPNKNKTKQS